jgi:Rod binding domain-containing protein
MTPPIAPPLAPSVAGGALAGPAAGGAAADPQIAEAARGFEGILISMMIDRMLAGTSIGAGNPLYAGLMTEKLGDALADAGGIGLAAVLERQLGAAP